MTGDLASTTKLAAARNPLPVWTCAILLGICFVGLTHDPYYLEFTEDAGIEQGEGLDERSAFDKDVNAAPLFRRGAFVGVFLLGAFVFATGKNQVECTSTLVMALLFGGIIFASATWSEDRGKTFRELFRIMVYAVVAFGFAKRFRPNELCFIIGLTMAISVGCACCAELATGKFEPLSDGYRLGGTLHTNALASHAAILTVLCFVFQHKSRYRTLLWGLMLMAFSVVILSRTRGALATCMVAIIASTFLFAWNSFRNSRAPIVLVTCVMISFCVLFVSLVATSQTVREIVLLGRSQDAVTLTGRTPLWELLVEESEDHRLLGFGYGAFWNEDSLEVTHDALEWYANHAHNAYLHTMLDTGLVGVAILLALVFTCIRRSAKLHEYTGDVSFCFFFAYFVAGSVDGLLEVAYIYPRALGLISLIAIAVTTSVPQKPTPDASTLMTNSVSDTTQ